MQERTIPEGVAEETSQEPVEAMAGEKPEEDIAASLALVEEKPVQLSMKVMDGKETLKCKVGETADPLELVQFSSDGSGDITAEASVASINLSHPHGEKVTYDVSTTSESGRITQEKFVVEYQVVDDECPKIDFGHKKISIEEGTYFDPLSNINYVRDAVEGEAEYYSSEPYEKPEHSWYTVDSQVDPDEAGVYKVYVHASDSSGNVKDREY